MATTAKMFDRDRAIEALTELIEALDRRVPHVERLGETGIVREAAALKAEAMKRIEELRRTPSPDTGGNALASAVKADAGGTLPR